MTGVEPTLTGVTIPVDEVIVATEVPEHDHVPPDGESLSVVVDPRQTADTPDMGAGCRLTVTGAVILHPVLSVYVMFADPVATPVTLPEVLFTVAIAVLLLLHVPPGVASLIAIGTPVQSDEGPLIVAGNGLTVTVAVVVA